MIRLLTNAISWVRGDQAGSMSLETVRGVRFVGIRPVEVTFQNVRRQGVAVRREGARVTPAATWCKSHEWIPDLTLKFVVHHGQYISHEVAGSRELIGPEVVAAHRLKNHVTEQTGFRGYALFTRACLETFGIDADAVGMMAHREVYEDVGG